ncbi:MAG: hypothetical protein ACRC33_16820, partial [Gemmataceae bacterium]
MPSETAGDLAGLLRPGATPTKVDGVWSFLPPEGGATPALAGWVLRRRDELFDAMRTPPDAGQFADCPAGAAEAARLLGTAQFGQVLNDLREMAAGASASTPTLDFFRSARPADEAAVLDVGCSAGRHLWELAPRLPGRHVGLDVDLLA